MAIKKPFKPSSQSLFKRYGGRMTINQINQILNSKTMHPWEKEYIKRVIEKRHYPTSPHITEKEFRDALSEMSKNIRDPVGLKRIEELRKRFGL